MASWAGNQDKTITILSPFTAGSDATVAAERLAKLMQKYMPETNIKVTPAAKPGARAVHDMLRKSKPDGKTLMLSSITDLIIQNIESEDPDWNKFDYVSIISLQPIVCVTHPQSPLRDYKVFLKTFKEKPETLRYATYSRSNNVFPTLLAHMLGTKANKLELHIITDLNKYLHNAIEEKTADFYCVTFINVLDKIRAGKMVPIFTNSLRVIDEMPQVPLAINLGMKGLERYSYWLALAAPKGTSKKVMYEYQKILQRVADDPEWKNLQELKYGASAINKIPNIPQFIQEQFSFFENVMVQSRFVN